MTNTVDLAGLADAWSRRWQEEGTYTFDRSADRVDVYAIDTPPPTVSGDLHIGSVYGYVQTDTVARYRRMRGQAVFYPMGWDDNGLPTERRAQYVYGVRCDPSLAYDPSFAPAEQPFDPPRAISRRNFIELCARLTATDEERFEQLWRRLGLSVDWAYTYTTIGTTARAASQRAFLRNLARGEAYQAEAPTLWDVGFQTAVAQAELEDRERPGSTHVLAFTGPSGPVHIETTRPELLPACVALVCHPSDARYAALVGRTVHTPLFDVEVPVHAHALADPEKGTGIAMVCTFGDLADVTWWRELSLPTRVVIGRDGRLLPEPPAGVPADGYAPLAGLTVAQARRAIVATLGETGQLVGEPRPITHPVKFYENGDSPLEIVATRQWYLRNGGRDPVLREALLARGHELRWVPEHMRHRYDHWVGGLIGDWLVSRQRFFGVPIPVWYPLREDGSPDYDRVLTPDEARLPVDPTSEPPDGYQESDRGRPGGFVGDPDVFDTWATSSLTPQIVSGWETDADLFARVYPMDLRPQGPEIIRTWLFASVVRAHLELGGLPWSWAVINGWILDPDRKKMSKSKGNTVTPNALIDRHGPDAVRYWAASGRPGTDLALDENQMRVGRRLGVKLLNASRFALGLGAAAALGEPVTEPLDRAMLASLSTVVDEATAAFEAYDYTSALQAAEGFFWRFCDDYIELVKNRAYGSGPGAESARAALAQALDVQLRLFAPVLPYVTEEIWSWWREGSVHRAPWPTAGPGDGRVLGSDSTASNLGLPGQVGATDRHSLGPGADADGRLLGLVSEALGQVRRAKSERKLSMRAEILRAQVRGPAEDLELLNGAADDLRAAGHIGSLELTAAAEAPLTVHCVFP